MEEIVGYPGYYITEYGTIYCNNPINGVGELRTGEMRLLKHKINYSGYHEVVLYNKTLNKKGYKRVHRLVAEKFIRNPLNLPSINHIDENKNNNHISNLEWCSHQYNTEHSLCKTEYILEHKITGKVIKFYNLYKTCKELNISRYSLYRKKESGEWRLICPHSLLKTNS
jgi:hypothetical protein